ncbi:MAG: hypothetical protein HYV09_35905 [Deltaproteobacteria bacterium]|nr:hypothetical protein [Deltaproteobacteria bacterium]
MRVCHAAIAAASFLLAGCGPSREDAPIDDVRVAKRRLSVIVEGCVVDPWQSATLRSPASRAVLAEVILLCPAFRADGLVTPIDPAARSEVHGTVAALRSLGYRVTLGLRANDERGVSLGGAEVARSLASAATRTKIIDGLLAVGASADGVELSLLFVAASARKDLAVFASELRSALGSTKQLGVFAPPSVSEPSDLPDGDAYDLRAMRDSVSRVRLMTLDFSCCGAPPGPTIDPGWAVDAARFARSMVLPEIDVAYPLYGWDFSSGAERPVTFFEARGIAAWRGVPIERGPTHAPHFRWTDTHGAAHDTWFDDATSTVRALEAWPRSVLPDDVGVVLYGLGAEDPALFPALQRAMR